MSASKINKKNAASALAKNQHLENIPTREQFIAIDNAYENGEEVGAIENDERVQRILQ